MKSSLSAVKRQRFPAQAGRQVHGIFIHGVGIGLFTQGDDGFNLPNCKFYLAVVIRILSRRVLCYCFGIL